MDEGSVSHINIHICGAWLPGCVVVGWCIVLVLGYDRPLDGMGLGEVSHNKQVRQDTEETYMFQANRICTYMIPFGTQSSRSVTY